ncbi:hypothetical protein DL93DRAFT_1807375 [Clavulina sp. PMI_390]|nr:hypothetical protein DL93DRAFT_1807375 [Clavulina sp. PMI_390]
MCCFVDTCCAQNTTQTTFVGDVPPRLTMSSDDNRPRRWLGSSLSSLSDSEDTRSRAAGTDSRAPTTDMFSPSRQSDTLSDTQPERRNGSESGSSAHSSLLRRVAGSPGLHGGSPTRSRSPWPPPSEGDEDELEVEAELTASIDDSSLAEEEILAQLQEGQLDPFDFTRHALSHISEANEDGTRASVLSRDWAPSVGSQSALGTGLGGYDRRTQGSTSSFSDYGGDAFRRQSIFNDVNRPLSSYSAGSIGRSEPDAPRAESPTRISLHSRAATDPSERHPNPPTYSPVRHTASPVGRRAANLIAMFEQQAASSEGGSISNGSSGSGSSQDRRTASEGHSQTRQTFPSPSMSAPGGLSNVLSNPRFAESGTSFPRMSNVPSITSSGPSSPTKSQARSASPLKSSIAASDIPPPLPPKEPRTPERRAPLPPDNSFARPAAARLQGKGSPRAPLTSVRNIVAAFSSREGSGSDNGNGKKPAGPPPVVATSPSAPTTAAPAPAPVPASQPSFGDGSFSIRRRAGPSGTQAAAGLSEFGARIGGDGGNGGESSLGAAGGSGGVGDRSSGLRRRESMAPSLHPSEAGSNIQNQEVCAPFLF